MHINEVKPYKKSFDYSYALGAYATIEMLRFRAASAKMVIIHSSCKDASLIRELCNITNTEIYFNDKAFLKISSKENIFAIGVFEKYKQELRGDMPHIVLVNPQDMGNLGTIIRSSAAFNMIDIAIITPAADIFNPKTIRASMGSIFHTNYRLYESFYDYMAEHRTHVLYPFMLDGAVCLDKITVRKNEKFSLVFGNEAAGLPKEFSNLGVPVKISQSQLVDSLNISMAAGIGAYHFASKWGLID